MQQQLLHAKVGLGEWQLPQLLDAKWRGGMAAVAAARSEGEAEAAAATASQRRWGGEGWQPLLLSPVLNSLRPVPVRYKRWVNAVEI